MLFYKERLLNAAQLKRLSDHKYSCSNISILDPWLQPWWCWLVARVPLWLAPNLITIVGLFVNIVTTLILVWYSPDAKIEAPRWACALCAFGLFVYQSLDAIDGKQARRTNSSSPLGELFDHGCDSISTVFVALSACIAVQLGNYPNWLFFQCFCAMSLFYCAHWQTYVSGTLRFGRVDVTEAQFTIFAIHMISAAFGPSVWMNKFGSWFELRFLVIIMTIVCGCWSLYNMLAVILAGGVGKNGSTVAGTSVLSPIIPFSLVVIPAFIICQKSPDNIFENHPALYILAFGMVAAKVTNRLVVAHMTKSEMEYLDWALLGPSLLFLNQYFNNFVNEYYVLCLCLALSIFDLMRYCAQVCLEICDHLRIQLFRIPYPPKSVGSTQAPQSQTDKNAHIKIRQEGEEDEMPLLKDDETQ
ncbi:cholinephosphotransferase 1 [Ctenocephalides felis]|uniref:cholinephosphotransferase 1 n=1 Tax=Ctenocephalides felis TaxID=7515 RepID=UPI000E6E1DFE|nr:cholinephosphotransferase 1 [Ctenocephalides felis]